MAPLVGSLSQLYWVCEPAGIPTSLRKCQPISTKGTIAVGIGHHAWHWALSHASVSLPYAPGAMRHAIDVYSP